MYRFQISLGDEPRNRVVAKGLFPRGAVGMDCNSQCAADAPPDSCIGTVTQWIEALAYGVGDSWGHVTCLGDGVQRLAGNCEAMLSKFVRRASSFYEMSDRLS